MRPFYSDGRVILYRGDCDDILPSLPAPDLLLTDPPYGVVEKTFRGLRGRSGKTRSRDFFPVQGDRRPFDPAHLAAYPRVILFGANNYADRLPPSRGWIVWDKLDGLTTPKRTIGFNDNGDAELAWTNIPGPIRIIRHRWMGVLRASEIGERRTHPTQKPVAVMRAIIAHYSKPGDLVIDPYAGSGSTLIAAVQEGRVAIGIELEAQYCAAFATRMSTLDTA